MKNGECYIVAHTIQRRIPVFFHLKKINLRLKLSPLHVFECLCVRQIFELPEMAKTEVLDFSGPT